MGLCIEWQLRNEVLLYKEVMRLDFFVTNEMGKLLCIWRRASFLLVVHCLFFRRRESDCNSRRTGMVRMEAIETVSLEGRWSSLMSK